MDIRKEIKGYLSGVREVFRNVPINTIEEIIQVFTESV